MNRQPRIGEIYLMNFGGTENEQRGVRPGLVFQNNMGNAYSPNIIALPLTTSLKKLNQPTHVLLDAKGTGLRQDSMVLCENPERMSKDRIGTYLTTLPAEYMSKVAVANILASSAVSFLDAEELLVAWRQAVALNVERRGSAA